VISTDLLKENKMNKVAPTLIVDKIEPSLKFWIETLGFSKVADVPGDDSLVFAMVVNEKVEVHLQSRASVGKNIPYLAESQMPPSSFLYIDVENIKALYEKLKGCEVLLPLEKTFYGATHFFIREPGGHVIGFSQNE
jgi:uncharacterized glyoxalase superfamily protein PhnB